MKCYYAHCMAIYGTPQEERDIKTLKALGFEVLNPNSPGYIEEAAAIRQHHEELHTSDPGHYVMNYFMELVSTCECLAFRALPDGKIPAGVAKEIAAARENDLPIMELPSALTLRAMSVEATREFLTEIGQR